MNKVLKAFSILALVSVAVLAGRQFTNPTDASMNCPEIQNYLSQGFTLDSVTPNAYRYIAAPTGNYDWGTVTVQLHGRTGGPYSLQTTYVTVTCYIKASEKGGNVKYDVGGTDVIENIVY